jgi:hypothetical protein
MIFAARWFFWNRAGLLRRCIAKEEEVEVDEVGVQQLRAICNAFPRPGVPILSLPGGDPGTAVASYV